MLVTSLLKCLRVSQRLQTGAQPLPLLYRPMIQSPSLILIPTTPSLIPNVLIYLSIPSSGKVWLHFLSLKGNVPSSFAFPVNTCTSFPSLQSIFFPLLDPHSSFLHLRSSLRSWSVGMASVGACPVKLQKKGGNAFLPASTLELACPSLLPLLRWSTLQDAPPLVGKGQQLLSSCTHPVILLPLHLCR